MDILVSWRKFYFKVLKDTETIILSLTIPDVLRNKVFYEEAPPRGLTPFLTKDVPLIFPRNLPLKNDST